MLLEPQAWQSSSLSIVLYEFSSDVVMDMSYAETMYLLLKQIHSQSHQLIPVSN